MNTSTIETNGTDAVRMTEPMREDELEFRRALPIGQWLLVTLEKPKKLSTIIHGVDVRSPFAVVVAVGPDFKADVQPGDRVTYAECLNLPKEMQGLPWADRYKWLHENKLLGRLARPGEEITRLPSSSTHALDLFFARINKGIDRAKESGAAAAFADGLMKAIIAKMSNEG